MKKISTFLVIGLLAVLLLAGCGDNAEVPPVTPTDETTADVFLTDTPTPTESEPVQAGMMVLVAPGEINPEKIQELETAASAAALDRGLVFEKRGEIGLQTAPENLVMVLAAADFAGLPEMVDAFPEVLFLVAGASAMDARSNLTVLGEAGDLDLTQAFMAGYIAAVQSEEYRIGIISVNDADGQEYRDAFLNGVIYFCGKCAPIYPPFETYPLYTEVAPTADRAALEVAAQSMIARGVNMMLIAPDLQSSDFYQYLTQNGVRIVGTDAPPSGLEGYWVASVLITSQYGLKTTIGALLDKGELSISGSKVEITYTGAGEARVANFLEILDQLNSGAIDPLGKVE